MLVLRILQIAHGHESSLVELPTLNRQRDATRIESRGTTPAQQRRNNNFSAPSSRRTEHQVLDNASKIKAVMECLRHIVIFN